MGGRDGRRKDVSVHTEMGVAVGDMRLERASKWTLSETKVHVYYLYTSGKLTS